MLDAESHAIRCFRVVTAETHAAPYLFRSNTNINVETGGCPSFHCVWLPHIRKVTTPVCDAPGHRSLLRVSVFAVRLCSDRVGLIKECICQAPTCYKQAAKLLDLAELLRVAGKCGMLSCRVRFLCYPHYPRRTSECVFPCVSISLSVKICLF